MHLKTYNNSKIKDKIPKNKGVSKGNAVKDSDTSTLNTKRPPLASV